VGDGTALAELELALAAALLGAGWWRLGPAVLAVAAVPAALQLLRSSEGRRVVARLHPQWAFPCCSPSPCRGVAATIATGGAFPSRGDRYSRRGARLHPFENHGFFPGFYAVTAVAALFPWFGLLPAALSRLHRDEDRRLALPGRLAVGR